MVMDRLKATLFLKGQLLQNDEIRWFANENSNECVDKWKRYSNKACLIIM